MGSGARPLSCGGCAACQTRGQTGPRGLTLRTGSTQSRRSSASGAHAMPVNQYASSHGTSLGRLGSFCHYLLPIPNWQSGYLIDELLIGVFFSCVCLSVCFVYIVRGSAGSAYIYLPYSTYYPLIPFFEQILCWSVFTYIVSSHPYVS